MTSTQRTALVTGGRSGIGEATAARLRAEGTHVIVMDLHPDADVVVDVSVAGQVRAAAERVGAVDILVNCAGIGRIGMPVWETSDEDWAAQIGVNLTGTFHTCRAFVPGMVARGWGRVVNVASMAGKEGNALAGAYSASKAGVIGLTKSLGKELATTGVLVNAIAPGVIDTPMIAVTADTDPAVVAAHEATLAKIPMHRRGRPEEVADLIEFLTSDRTTFSTGFTFDLSGGRAVY